MIEILDARGDGKKTIYPKMVYMGQNSTLRYFDARKEL